jgi:hypothetical protein
LLRRERGATAASGIRRVLIFLGERGVGNNTRSAAIPNKHQTGIGRCMRQALVQSDSGHGGNPGLNVAAGAERSSARGWEHHSEADRRERAQLQPEAGRRGRELLSTGSSGGSRADFLGHLAQHDLRCLDRGLVRFGPRARFLKVGPFCLLGRRSGGIDEH